MQSLSPLADCSVNDTMVKAVSFLKQSFFQMINVTNPTVVTCFCKYSRVQQAINGSS